MMKEKRRQIYVKLPYEIGVSQSSYKEYEYILYEEGNIINRFTIDKQPKDISNKSTKLQEFIKTLLTKEDLGVTDEEGDFIRYTKDQLQEKIQKTLAHLQGNVDSYHQNKDKRKEEQQIKNYNERLTKAKEGHDKLCVILEEYKVAFTDYVIATAMWENGGETKNTLKGFLCHCSTYLGRKAVWFLVLGPSGEGKSIIELSARELMPRDAFINGRMTEATLHRKTNKEGECYLDNKIVVMGDMGGDRDFDKWEDTLNRYKELTTEGSVEVELVGEGKDETGERSIISFMVRGHPSVSMTSVHSEKLDDQIMSRGVNVTPEATDEQVGLYVKYNVGKYKRYYESTIKEFKGLIHDYITYIKLAHSDVEVIIPYMDCIINWLDGSEYFKRQLEIIKLLIETVTILNYNFREKILSDDGVEYLVSAVEDGRLVTSFFDRGFGLSESAKLVMNKLIEVYNKGEQGNGYHLTLESYEDLANLEYADYNDNHGRLDNKNTLFSVSTVKHRFAKIESMKKLEVGEIFRHLVDFGYIVPMGKVYRSNNNVYRLGTITPLENDDIDFDDDIIWKYVEEMSEVHGVDAPHLWKLVKSQNEYTASPWSIPRLEVAPWVSLSALSVPLTANLKPRVPSEDEKVPLSAEEIVEAK